MQQDPYGDVDTMLQAAQDIYYRAMVNAVTDCMLIQGYTYQSVPDPAYNLTDFLTRHPWNSPTSEVAAVRGYLLPGQGVPVDNPDGDSGLGNDAYQHALYGDVIDNWELGPGETVPEGFAVGGPIMDGCRPTAQRAIQGVGDPRAAWRIFDYFYQMQGIESPATHEITSNPDYQLAVTAWSACMKEAGYDYTTLEQPPNDGWSSPRPGPAEVATATADASCKASSGLTNLGDQLFDQITTDWFSQHPTSYAEITDYVKGVTDRSTAILES